MAKLANRAKMTISSTGTGNITLASAVAGYQSFLDAGVSDGDQIRYIVEDNSGADWEIGTAAVSNNSTVLVRTVEESSAANNAALNLTSSATVFIGVTARDLDNAVPIFTTTPPTALELQNDGSTAVTLNAKAYDESGIPVQYSWDAWATGGTTIYDESALPPQFASAPSINQSTGVYSLVGSSNSSNAGSVNFRVKASDGVKVATANTSLVLSFGLSNCYGFRMTQTSGSSLFIMYYMLLDGNGANMWDDASFLADCTFSNHTYSGQTPITYTNADNSFAPAYMKAQQTQLFGTTMADPNSYKIKTVADQSQSAVGDVTWTTPRSISAIVLSGAHPNGSSYWQNGDIRPYIGGNATSNIVAAGTYTSTSSPPLSSSTASGFTGALYKFIDFTA